MKRLFYIDYPQEHIEGQLHSYRCAFCKVITTKINGNLDGHLPDCAYRIKLEQAGFENAPHPKTSASAADEVD